MNAQLPTFNAQLSRGRNTPHFQGRGGHDGGTKTGRNNTGGTPAALWKEKEAKEMCHSTKRTHREAFLEGFGCRNNYFAASRQTRFGKRTHRSGFFRVVLPGKWVRLGEDLGPRQDAVSGDTAYNGIMLG